MSWVGLHTSSPAAPWVGLHPSSPTVGPRRGWASAGGLLLAVAWVAPTPPRRRWPHRTISQFDLRWRCQPADEVCPSSCKIQPAQGIPVNIFVMDGGSMRTLATRSPEVECAVWAVGVSARAISVLVGGSMISRRKEIVSTGTRAVT